MFQRGTIISYDQDSRTAQVHIHGLTDGSSEGLTATFAYAVGHDDRDTEIQIIIDQDPDVYVFFENGDQARPVIAFFSSHGANTEKDTHRIRQKNIELLAEQNIDLNAPKTTVHGDLHVLGKVISDVDVVAKDISLVSHKTSGVESGSGFSGPPSP